MVGGSNGGFALLFGADAQGLFDGGNKHLAIADLAGLGGSDDRAHGGVGLAVGHDEFDFYFRQEIHGVFAAAIDFGVALLAAKPLDLAHGHAFDADAAVF